jgi:hypothetical protein
MTSSLPAQRYGEITNYHLAAELRMIFPEERRRLVCDSFAWSRIKLSPVVLNGME